MPPDGEVPGDSRPARVQRPTHGREPARPPAVTVPGCSVSSRSDDFEAAARRHLPRMLYGFVSGAAETDAALRDNRAAFQELGFVPRVLADVSARQTGTALLGRRYAAPFGIAPDGGLGAVGLSRRPGLRPGGGGGRASR